MLVFLPPVERRRIASPKKPVARTPGCVGQPGYEGLISLPRSFAGFVLLSYSVKVTRSLVGFKYEKY